MIAEDSLEVWDIVPDVKATIEGSDECVARVLTCGHCNFQFDWILTHTKSVTSAIITVLMVLKPPSSTKTGHFRKGRSYQIVCGIIVLWKWNLALSS